MRIYLIIALFFASFLIIICRNYQETRKTPYYLFEYHPADLSSPHERKLRRLKKNKELYKYRSDNVKKLIRKVHAFMEDSSIPYWVESGILLGIYHYNDVLPYDCDLDIGVTDITPFQKIFDNKKENIIKFQEYGISLEKTTHHAIPYVFRDLETDVYCDVFYYTPMGSRLVQKQYYSKNPLGDWPCKGCTGTVFSLERDNVFPTRTITTDGDFTITIPNNPEACLSYLYGDLTPYYRWSDKENDFIRKDLE